MLKILFVLFRFSRPDRLSFRRRIWQRVRQPDLGQKQILLEFQTRSEIISVKNRLVRFCSKRLSRRATISEAFENLKEFEKDGGESGISSLGLADLLPLRSSEQRRSQKLRSLKFKKKQETLCGFVNSRREQKTKSCQRSKKKTKNSDNTKLQNWVKLQTERPASPGQRRAVALHTRCPTPWAIKTWQLLCHSQI